MDAQNKQDQLDELLAEKYEPIAIVGMSMRFPGGVNNGDAFRKMLAMGEEGIGPIPADRWDNQVFFSKGNNQPGSICTHSGGFMDNIDEFDPTFFSISPKEANNIDPQQRIMLELTWEALEQGNIAPSSLRGEKGGVYVGLSTVDYTRELLGLAPEQWVNQMGTGTANSAVSGRVSYFLGLRGPCLSLDTACSSSLVSIHLAVNGLRAKESNIAVCGGINVIHHPSSHIIFSDANMLAQDGRCKTFDESADGYGRSEGCAVLVLKRLSDAIKDNNNILALVRGSSVLQDGESGGLTVPNGKAQEVVMREAILRSMLNPGDINYVEAHGTGTPLGDPIEVNSVHAVFKSAYSVDSPVTVASVKSNLGHMEATAGMGGVIKVLLQMQDSVFYPHRNMDNPSSKIQWDELCIKVPTETTTWPHKRKRALVNSFGFAGTIASVVLESAESFQKEQVTKAPLSLLTISAKSPKALQLQAKQYKTALDNIRETQFPAFCYSSNVGRSHFKYRMQINGEDLAVVRDKLKSNIDKLSKAEKGQTATETSRNAFLFTGQGSQYPFMAKALLENSPSFRMHAEICDDLFSKYLGFSVIALINEELEDSAGKINQTQYTQPALFIVEYAMAKALISWGCTPSILIGHSIGEIVAATIAELFTLEDAIKLVYHRARLMQSVTAKGGMLAVQASKEKLALHMSQFTGLDFAAFNGPQQTVVSGDIDALEKLEQGLKGGGIGCKALTVSHAFHSAHMEEVFDEFTTVLNEIKFYPPTMPFVSNITGEIAKFKDVSCAEYWLKHVRNPVDFLNGIKCISKRGAHNFIEVGPSPHLIALGKSAVDTDKHRWITTLSAEVDAISSVRKALGALYLCGLELNWQAVHQGIQGQTLPLPFYPFEKKRYWLPTSTLSSNGSVHPLLGKCVVNNSKAEANLTWQYKVTINSNSPDYLADHVVMGKIIFPGAGYMEMLLALQDDLFGDTQNQVKKFFIHQPLVLQENDNAELLTSVEHTSEHTYSVQIHSVDKSEGQGNRLHVTAIIDTGDLCLRNLAKEVFTPEMKQAYWLESDFSSDEMYNKFLDVGLQYGPKFQKVSYSFKDTPESVYGQVKVHHQHAMEILNPTLLDAVLHTMESIVPEGKTLLPVGFEKFQLYRKPRGKLETKVRLHQVPCKPSYDVSADMVMYSEGKLVFAAYGLGLKEVKQTSSNKNTFLHELAWQEAKLKEQDFKERYALLLTHDDIAEEHLASYDSNISIVASVEDLLNGLNKQPEINHVFVDWQFPEQSAEKLLNEVVKTYFEDLLKVIKELENNFSERELQLNIITCGSQFINSDSDNTTTGLSHLLQNTVWGFSNVLNNELGRFKTRCIDLQADASNADKYKALVQELFFGTSQQEQQVAWRNGKRYVRRIVKADPQHADNFELAITEYGTLSGVTKCQRDAVTPLQDSIKVKVKAAGVNFKDVLNTLGMLKQHAEASGYEYQPLPLGFECSGTVVEAGPEAEFSPGDDVIISQVGCMERYLTVSSKVAVRKPSNISFEQAAGLATAYITSYYALHHLADLKRDEKVLIHAAAGGVGQASVQLAKRIGAQVYATASESKWQHLMAQGIQHIYNSRSLDFSQQIIEATNKKGVDVVLNSLNKDFIPASLDATSENGRFVEIGKIGIWDKVQVAERKPTLSYYNFDLSEMSQDDLNTINKSILQNIVSWIESEEIQPLPVTSFKLDALEEAFGMLSRGQNIGKVVLCFDDQQTPVPQAPVSVSKHGNYLITGGMGALGNLAAKWLAQNGASTITLVGRSLRDQAGFEKIQRQCAPARVEFKACDIGDKNEIARLVRSCHSQESPLKGIIHGAGVLADSPVLVQNWGMFQQVFTAKVSGSWWLHEALAEADIEPDFFVGYSSVASVVGSVSQCNYAAANAFIDNLMAMRCRSGHHGLAVNWGPWADVGMAARLSEQQIKSIEDKGIHYIKSKQGMDSLKLMLHSGMSQAIAGEYDWSKYQATLPNDNHLYDAVVESGSDGKQLFSLDALVGLPVKEQEQQILDSVKAIVAKVLQYDDADSIASDARFSDLGLDSLVAVELRNSLDKTFALSFPSSLVFDYPSVPAISGFICSRLNLEELAISADTKSETIFEQQTQPRSGEEHSKPARNSSFSKLFKHFGFREETQE